MKKGLNTTLPPKVIEPQKTVVIEMLHPNRKFRPIPKRKSAYEKPRLAIAKSPNPIARIASFKWGRKEI
jgi:hypothetical protein